ncbi:DUF6777 domain-containing protein, partial [Streptomyces sp. NPDC091259]|uniref:DUF6777 domain-containing protein n=1 Tax=Streptomyces sp. NPDC091259 TaxID=3365976 RepID=UPI003808E4F7
MSAGAAVGIATAVVLGFTVMGGNKASGGEVFLQATSAAGLDPFTPSTATASEQTEVTPAMANASKTGASGARTLEVDGAQPGLYGGTRNVASCDVEKQIQFLGQHTDKRRAFAQPLNIQESGVPAYLRSLTPVRLSWDTRVTNHGYRNGATTSYQAVLQAGTPVLVDNHGVPRVRCACGNPLAPPVAVKGKQTYSGKQWTSFRSSDLVAVKPAEKPVKAVTMFDQSHKGWYQRPSGDAQGRHDHEIPAPSGQKPDSPYPVLPAPQQEPGVKPPETPQDKSPDQNQNPGQDQHNKPDQNQNPDKDQNKVPDKNQNPDKDQNKVPDKNQNPGQDQQKPDQNKVPDKDQNKVPEQPKQDQNKQDQNKVPEQPKQDQNKQDQNKVPEQPKQDQNKQDQNKVPDQPKQDQNKQDQNKVPDQPKQDQNKQDQNKVPDQPKQDQNKQDQNKVPDQ